MVLRSFLRLILVLWVTVTLVFILLRVLPGDPVTTAVFQAGGTEETAAERRAELGLDDPLHIQYLHYIVDTLRGDTGHSILYAQPVSQLIIQRLLSTVALAFAAFAVALFLGIVLGVFSALDAPRLLRIFSDGVITLALSVPVYLTALLAIYLFSIYLDILPVFGTRTPLHLVLPALTLGFHTSGSIARVFSTSLRETFNQPFMLTAKAKGLPAIDRFDHALRVALLPVFSMLALQAGFLLGGTVIIEFIFSRQGLGALLFQAVQGHDYPLVQALTMLIALFYVTAGAFSQWLRALLDPRLRY